MNNIYFGNRDLSFRDDFITPSWGVAWQTLYFTDGSLKAHQCTSCCGGVKTVATASGAGARMCKQVDNFQCLAGNLAIISANLRCANNFTVVRFGLHDGGGSTVTDGVYFECNSTNQRWDLMVMNNSTLVTATGPARDNDYHEFAIDLQNLDRAMFFIDGVKIDEINTNFPTGVAGRSVSSFSITAKKETAGAGVEEEICAVRATVGRYKQKTDLGMMT